MTTKKRRPIWTNPWVICAAIFGGFMFGAAVTAAVPASALWTGRFVCSAPYHLAHLSASTSYGFNTSQTSVSFACVNGASAHEVGTFSIFGLQLLLGAVLSYGVIIGIASLWRLRRKLQTA